MIPWRNMRPMTNTALRLPQVLKQTGLSRSSLYKFISEGGFPRPIHLGPRSVAWLQDEIDDWFRSRTAERDARPRVL